MKEFICNLIQRMGTFFNPKHEKQVQVEKANGNTRKLQRFLLERFDFRYNLLTGVTEYRSKSVTNTPFSPIDERNMNGMIVDARLKQEVLDGERDYLNKEEEKEVQRRNKAYYRQSPLEDIFHACYRRPKADEEGEWFTAAEMFRTMNKRNASALRGISAKQLSYRLTAMGFKPRHTNHGNYYHVVQTGTAA